VSFARLQWRNIYRRVEEVGRSSVDLRHVKWNENFVHGGADPLVASQKTPVSHPLSHPLSHTRIAPPHRTRVSHPRIVAPRVSKGTQVSTPSAEE
jgi:hypothetical protein